MKTAEQGTVSHGTMRPEDFVPAFLAVLRECDHPKADELTQEWETMDESSDEYEWFTNETIWDAMQEVAPDNCYFGAHPGDGSDYGFWENEEEDF